MNAASIHVRDFTQPGVSGDDELLAADAALDAYVEAAPRAKSSVLDLAVDAYLRLFAACRAQELQWLGVLEGRLGRVCEKRGQDVYGRVARKALPAVHQFHKFLFRRYTRSAFRLYSRELLHARRLEVEHVLLQFHDCPVLARVLADVGKKFDALGEALERRCEFRDVHGAHSIKNEEEDR